MECFKNETANFFPGQPDLLKSLEANFQERMRHIPQDFCWEKLFEFLQKYLKGLLERLVHECCLEQLTNALEITLCLKEYCFREYDFLLIGPKIGIVIIEVKNSSFTKANNFSTKSKYLPDEYKKGLEQLESANALVRLLHECSEVEMQEPIRVRRILFTPNLEKSRYSDWIANLDDFQMERVQEKVGAVIQWFKEDLANGFLDDESCQLGKKETLESKHDEWYLLKKPPLYTAIRKIFEKSDSIPASVYETYGPIVAALASVITNRTKDASCDPELEKVNFSEMAVILK